METKIIENENKQMSLFDLDGKDSAVDVAFCLEVIGLLKTNIRSEDPKDYGLNDAKNLDLFSWEMVEESKNSNAKIRNIIDKLENKISAIKLSNLANI